MLDQRVQTRTTHLNEKYEQLTTNYKELCRLVIKMRSHMDVTCAPPNRPHGSWDDQPPLTPPPALLLF